MIERSVLTRFEEPASSRFPDIMVGLNTKFQLGLIPRTITMAVDGEKQARNPRDASHDSIHYEHMGLDTALILDRYPVLRDQIDWNAYIAAVSFHDAWVSSLTPRPWNLWLAQHREYEYAAEPAEAYMRAHEFSAEEIERVTYLIRVHPFGFDDPRRLQLERGVDETLRLTGRFMYIVDSLDVFRPSRIDALLVNISNSYWGISVVPFYTQLARYFERNTNFSFDLGPDYPWIREEAKRRKDQALAYVHELEVTKRDVSRSVMARWR